MNESADPIPPNTCALCGSSLSGGLCPRCLMADAALATQAPGGVIVSATPAQAEVAAAFPQLEILELVGTGGMGTVWRARQPKLNRSVALKLLPASITERDPAFAERFEREGQLLARLHHPNIVTVHDSGRAGDFFYLLMEFVDGVNLRQAMRASRFTPQQALAIVPKICDALQYAHEEGVLHRDIKPENILLDARGRVKLVDFGIAKLMAQPDTATAAGSAPQGLATNATDSLTLGDTTLGTPQYMAPEQMEQPGDVDHRADIYSLGVVFYELLTGELPLGKFAPPSERSASDPRLDGIVRQALEKERDRRQHSVGEFRTQVETIVSGSGQAHGEGPAEVTGPPRFSRTAIAGACFAVPALVVAALALMALLGSPMRPEGYFGISPAYFLLQLAVLLFVPATVLGWIAVGKIRRSSGKLRGLGLAVFDGLLFPVLALDALIMAADLSGRAHDLPQRPDGVILRILNIPGSVAVFLLVTIMVVDFLIIRRVWRMVQPPSDRGSAGSAGNTALAVIAMFCVGMSGVLGTLTIVLQWRVPQLVVWSILIAALLGVVLGFGSRRSRLGRSALRGGLINTAIWFIIAIFGPRIDQTKPVPVATDDAAHSTAASLVFGPVIEREVVEAIDFDTGKLATSLPESVTKSNDIAQNVMAAVSWMEHEGMDALTEPSHELKGVGVKAKAVDKEAWDHFTLDQIISTLGAAKRETWQDLDPNRKTDEDRRTPATWVFETREGGKGILQVLEPSGQGVKVRYKLVRGLAPQPAVDDSLTLAQAVNDFNKRYLEAAAAAKQADLTTVEDVIAAIRLAMRDRAQLSVTNATFAALGRVIETQVLPKDFELELLTSYEDEETTKNVWSVRLRIPGTVIPGGTTCIMIHEQLLSTHVNGVEERKVIHDWREKESRQGGIGSFERVEYRKQRDAAAAIDAGNRPAAIADPLHAIELKVARQQLEKVLTDLQETQTERALLPSKTGLSEVEQKAGAARLELKLKVLEEQAAELRAVVQQGTSHP